MTTVRKLVLELGIVGDDVSKHKIEDFQASANALKQTLIEVEKQLETLGKANFPVSGGMLVPTPSSLLTSQEKEAIDKQAKLIEQQTQAAKDREEKQINLQEKLIQSLQDQAAGQVQLIKEITSEMKTDRQFFINISKEMAGIIDAALGYIRREERPLGAQGPTPHENIRVPDPNAPFGFRWEKNPKYEQFMKPLTDLIERMEDAAQNLATLPQELQTEILDDLRKMQERLKKLGDPVKDHVKQLSDFIDQMQTQIVKPYIGTPEQEVQRLKQQHPPVKPEVKPKDTPEVHEVLPRTQIPRKKSTGSTLKLKTIDDLENAVKTLKAQGEEIKQGEVTQKLGESVDDHLARLQRELQEIEDKNKAAEIFAKARKDVLGRYGLSERRLEVAKEFEQEKERDKIGKEVSEMRAEMEEQWKHEEDIRRRGFAWQPEERLRNIQKRAQKWAKKQEEELPARIGSWFAGTKVGRKLGFKPAEEYLENKKASREMSARMIERDIESEYERQRVVANITINNPLVDNDERKEQLIRDITNAMRGL